MYGGSILKFKAIAEHHTISEAADSIFITQSALSHSLSMLEEELGCKLFIRGAHQEVQLTKDGEDLLEYANIIDDLFSQIETRFIKKNIISISAVNISSAFILMNFPRDQLETIRMIPAAEKDMPRMLQNGELDIAICDDTYIKDDYRKGSKLSPLSKQIICTQQLALLVREDHCLFNKKRISYEELGQTPLSMQTTADTLREWTQYITDETGFKFNIAFATDSYSYHLIRDDLHYPELVIKNSVFNPFPRIDSEYKYKLVLLDGFYSYREVYMWYLKKSIKKVQPIIDNLKNIYSIPIENMSANERIKVSNKFNA